MPKLIPNDFSQYEFTPEEERSACTFTDLQLCYIQNQIASIAMQKATLKIDVNNPLSFAQEDSYLTGQIEILQHLLEVDSIAKDETKYELSQED